MPYQQLRTRIGQRNQRIHIQSQDLVDDGMGGRAPSALGWQTVCHAWASVTPLDERTREAISGQQVTSRMSYHFDIAYRDGVQPQMRAEWRNQLFEIQNVAPDDAGKKKRLILLCSEVQGDGE